MNGNRMDGGVGVTVAEIGGFAVAEIDAIIQLAGLPCPAEEWKPG
jgi:hypothetical protein